MQRLFSSFAHGAPGAGMLLMRLAAAASLALHDTSALRSGDFSASAGLGLATLVAALLLLLGLWMPAACALAAFAVAGHGVVGRTDVGLDALLGILCIALALIGPGAWSVDARRFGWRRLDLAPRARSGRS